MNKVKIVKQGDRWAYYVYVVGDCWTFGECATWAEAFAAGIDFLDRHS